MASKKLSNAVKKRKIRAITLFKVIQGHSSSSKTVSIESPYATSYEWLILTHIPLTVSELSQLRPTAQILDTAFLSPPPGGGLRDNVRCSSWAHCKARNRLLISVNWIFLARYYGWVATILLQRGQFNPKFKVEGVATTIHFFHRWLWPMKALQHCRWQFLHKELQTKCNFRRKSAVLHFRAPPLGGLTDNVRWSS